MGLSLPKQRRLQIQLGSIELMENPSPYLDVYAATGVGDGQDNKRFEYFYSHSCLICRPIRIGTY